MAARHALVVWHQPAPSSPSALLVAIQLTTTERDDNDLVGGWQGGGEEVHQPIHQAAVNVQPPMVTITVCLLSG